MLDVLKYLHSFFFHVPRHKQENFCIFNPIVCVANVTVKETSEKYPGKTIIIYYSGGSFFSSLLCSPSRQLFSI